MTPTELHQRAMELFDQACDLSPEERDALLAQACAGQPDLRQKVERMLLQDAGGGALADAGDAGGAAEQLALAVAGSDAEAIPRTIGAYRIIREIGRGGMGVIYEAEQESPNRRVALKVLQSGMVSREILRRFQREAHVLGQLQHPGIAQVYEAGVADIQGGRRPYLAMELIDGLPLDRHAEVYRLTTAQRLELIARVCDAVQHAHQKGVIHRDLKPPNVLVITHATAATTRASRTASATRSASTIDAIGLPKVLDFGIARVTDADLHSATVQTEAGQLIGTLAYMSPEQISGDAATLDTRCDVYALGVMLYQLLSGRRPHEITGRSLPEAARVIGEQDPQRLGLHDKALRGDIETIVAKAMNRDRERRYGSAVELAADIRRHLSDEPIQARPTTTIYHLVKFARRNRGLVAGLGATIVALSGGLVATGYGLHRAAEATLLAQKESERTKRALQDVELVSDFQREMIENADVQELGRLILDEVRVELEREAPDLAAREMLQSVNPVTLARAVVDGSFLSRASQAAAGQFADRPKIESDIRESLALTYFGLGMYEQSLREAEASLALRREHLGGDHLDTIRMIGNKGHILTAMNRLEDARPFAEEALRRLRGVLPEEDRLVLEARDRMAVILRDLGDTDESLRRARALVADAERSLPPEDRKMLTYRQHLVLAHMRAEQYEEALPLSLGLLETFKRLHGESHPRTLACTSLVAGTLGRLGRLEEAESLYVEIVDRTQAALGEFDPRTIRMLRNLARIRDRLGNEDAARDSLEDLLDRQRRTLPAGDPAIQETIDALARLDAPE